MKGAVPSRPETGRRALGLELGPGCLEALHRHGVEEYPGECCGFLLGRQDREAGIRSVRSVSRARNVHPPGRLGDRFTVDPQDFLRLGREVLKGGLEIVGFYHSHPDRPARPSDWDARAAHPGYSYAILSVRGGRPAELTSWRLAEGIFQHEIVEEVQDPLG